MTFEMVIDWLEGRHWINKHKGLCILEVVKKWMTARLELHLPFEQVPAEKKNMVTLGLKFSMLVFNSYVQTNKTLDTAINLQYDFINHIFSMPSINKYFLTVIDANQH
mmetsp:Transcript_10499/g.10557  ORF Transcript_10499/g.10557 Transcript_10499/m.10557 type:complete len:108 (-) Transcript_10499:342-665(-)